MTATGKETLHEGGCLCGAVRYRAAGPASAAVHCHCRSCRLAAGSPVVTWITVDRDRFSFVQGTPSVYPSSPGVERTFCGRCGTPMTYASKRHPSRIDITVGSLDHPKNYPAHHHIWTSERLAWLHLDEHLPGYRGFEPGDD